MTELTQYTGLLDVQTGEVLTATIDNAAQVLAAARAQKNLINQIIREATGYLAELAEHRGTKTLHGERETIAVSGGTGTMIDPVALREALEAADCPQDRIDAAIVQTVSEKVDGRVIRQLRAANPNYAAAIDLATVEVEKAFSASVALRRQADE